MGEIAVRQPDGKEDEVFSIVTPSYNQAEYLAATIESVLSQQGDFSIDYLIMDGGSSDGSVEIIKRYQALLQRGEWPLRCRGIRYRWVSEKDRGQTDALSRGFEGAEGEIFAWLNSDDVYLPGALQAAADEFRNHPETGLVYGDAYYCNGAGESIGKYNTAAFSLDRLAWFNFICQPSSFFHREAFERAGGLDLSLQFAMDYDLWVRIGKKYPCRYLPRFLSSYRLHETSKTIRDDTLFRNAEEALSLVQKHFGWAPLNRIYNSCTPCCRGKMPEFLVRRRAVVTGAALICSVLRWIWLNRGGSRRDLQLFNGENIRKIFKSRIEIMTGKP
jgi:glycosyltransferase involved in cell wall biosynthesis